MIVLSRLPSFLVALLFMQLLLKMEEQLFLLGCPSLNWPFSIKGDVIAHLPLRSSQ